MLVRYALKKLAQRVLALGLVALVVTSSTGTGFAVAADKLSDAERSAIALVSAEKIRLVTTDLSAPGMEGRGTAQAGGDRAAKYIADRFAALRLQPIGDAGTFYQPVRFHMADMLPESRLTSGDLTFSLGKDFVFGQQLPLRSADLTARLVFAGFGVVSQELKRNDLANLEVRDKIVMVITGRPASVDEAAWGKTGGVRAAVSAAAAMGAAAVLVVATSGGADSYDGLADRYGRRRVTLAETPQPAVSPVVWLHPSAAARMLEGAGMSLSELRKNAEAGSAVSREIDRSVTLSIRVQHDGGLSKNVAGMIEGSDAKLKSEAVVFTAHYDAYGIARDGRIYPGAADNALGVAEMLAVAEALAGAPKMPRRSLIFLAVTGEEYGMLGSLSWVEHPTWPLSRITANVNFDGVGTETYGRVKQGYGFGGEYSSLGEVLRGVLEATGTDSISDPVPDQGIFYRSDQYSFAKKGIPGVNIFGGPGGDPKPWIARVFAWAATSYHQPGDVIRPDWSWEGPRDLAVIGLLVGLRVANADDTPKWLPSAPFKRQ